VGLARHEGTGEAGLLRLSQQPDRVALVHERRARLVAGAARRRRRWATLDFSEWDRPRPKVDEVLEVIEDGAMPPVSYTLIHPSARLSEEERATVLTAMRRMLADSPPTRREGEPEDR